MVMYYVLFDRESSAEKEGSFVVVRSDKYVSYYKGFGKRYSILGTFFHDNLKSNIYNESGLSELLNDIEQNNPDKRKEFGKIREGIKNVREQGRG